MSKRRKKTRIPDGVYLLKLVDAIQVDDQVELSFELEGPRGETVGRVARSLNSTQLILVLRACGWKVPGGTVAVVDLDALVGQGLECYGRIVDDRFKQVFLPLSELSGLPRQVV